MLSNTILAELRKSMPEKIAQDILNIQPIDPKLFYDVYKEAKSEEWLLANGYRPVSSDTKLMWVKDETESKQTEVEKLPIDRESMDRNQSEQLRADLDYWEERLRKNNLS